MQAGVEPTPNMLSISIYFGHYKLLNIILVHYSLYSKMFNLCAFTLIF
jgi:hypothetical protein